MGIGGRGHWTKQPDGFPVITWKNTKVSAVCVIWIVGIGIKCFFFSFAAPLPLVETIRTPEEIKAYRSVVLNDLLESEQAHVAEIRGLLENFLEPLQASKMWVTMHNRSSPLCNLMKPFLTFSQCKCGRICAIVGKFRRSRWNTRRFAHLIGELQRSRWQIVFVEGGHHEMCASGVLRRSSTCHCHFGQIQWGIGSVYGATGCRVTGSTGADHRIVETLPAPRQVLGNAARIGKAYGKWASRSWRHTTQHRHLQRYRGKFGRSMSKWWPGRHDKSNYFFPFRSRRVRRRDVKRNWSYKYWLGQFGIGRDRSWLRWVISFTWAAWLLVLIIEIDISYCFHKLCSYWVLVSEWARSFTR